MKGRKSEVRLQSRIATFESQGLANKQGFKKPGSRKK